MTPLPKLGDQVLLTVENDEAKREFEGEVTRSFGDAVIIDLDDAPIESVFVSQDVWDACGGCVLRPQLKVVKPNEGGYL